MGEAEEGGAEGGEGTGAGAGAGGAGGGGADGLGAGGGRARPAVLHPEYSVQCSGGGDGGSVTVAVLLPGAQHMRDLQVDVHDTRVCVRRTAEAAAAGGGGGGGLAGFSLEVAFGARVDRAGAVAKFSRKRGRLTITAARVGDDEEESERQREADAAWDRL
jgi:HSP20 family molecular chaperone IbpA